MMRSEVRDNEAVGFWLGREALQHLHAINFRSRPMCERELFVLSNGFHAFREESIEYEVVPLPSSEVPTSVTKRETVEQQITRLPAIERSPEPVAITVHIKGYDPPPRVALSHWQVRVGADIYEFDCWANAEYARRCNGWKEEPEKI